MKTYLERSPNRAPRGPGQFPYSVLTLTMDSGDNGLQVEMQETTVIPTLGFLLRVSDIPHCSCTN
jgi:hypothetical protein